MIRKNSLIAAVFVALGITPVVHADSTLLYELSGNNGQKIEQTISISGRWLRLDTAPKGKADYIIMDLGRLLMFEVDDTAKNYQLTRMGRLYWPSTALTSPQFKPVREKKVVSGIRCQPVNEIATDKKPVAKHCMSAGGSLGLNAREMISLSRLFMSARRLGLDWSSVATPDERQVSLLSQKANGTTQKFKSVSHQRLDSTLFKVPVNYKRLRPDLPLKPSK